MNITHNNVALTRRVEISNVELQMIVDRTGYSIANLIAEKWVADNYDTLAKDKKFVEALTKAVIKEAAKIYGEDLRHKLGLEPQVHQQIQIKPELP